MVSGSLEGEEEEGGGAGSVWSANLRSRAKSSLLVSVSVMVIEELGPAAFLATYAQSRPTAPAPKMRILDRGFGVIVARRVAWMATLSGSASAPWSNVTLFGNL